MLIYIVLLEQTRDAWQETTNSILVATKDRAKAEKVLAEKKKELLKTYEEKARILDNIEVSSDYPGFFHIFNAFEDMNDEISIIEQELED